MFLSGGARRAFVETSKPNTVTIVQKSCFLLKFMKCYFGFCVYSLGYVLVSFVHIADLDGFACLLWKIFSGL